MLLVVSLLFGAAIGANPDLLRARQIKPRSAFTGHDFQSIATKLNDHLAKTGVATRSCNTYSLDELDKIALVLLGSLDDRLNSVYQTVGDRRSLRHVSAEGWATESAQVESAKGDVQPLRVALRDGKCAELVMLWAHHVPTSARTILDKSGLALPLLSTTDHRSILASMAGRTSSMVAGVYAKQISCSICHNSGAHEDPVLPERHSHTTLPPVWSHRFHVDFLEYTHQLFTAKAEKGSFHLDYPNMRMRWSHGKGHYNNWCECAGLPRNEASEACDIMSVKTKHDPAGAAYVVFRSLNKCCKLAGWDKGFSPIRPDWLTRPLNATTFLGQRQENGRVCYQWSNPNHGNPLMKADIWSEDADGIPCSYKDKFAWWAAWSEVHNLTFFPSSYSKDLEPDDMFAIPDGMDCSQTCPNRHTWCFFTTRDPSASIMV